MPFNIAAGNSSGYNYSSGRLDHQTYYKGVGIEQYECETVVLNHLFMAWLEEAWLVTDLLPQPPGRLAGWPHQWFWDGVLHVDPVKEAIAQQARLRNGTTTLADEWAQTGYDWREKADQRAVEREYYASKGMTYPGDTPAPHTATDPAAAPTGDGNADPNAD
jgi:capsid protein